MSLSHLDTIELIANDCISKLHPNDATYIAKLKENLHTMHHTYGRWIRNTYGLWSTNPLTEKWRTDPTSHKVVDGVDYSPDHPDAISHAVLVLIQKKVRGIVS